MGHVIFVSMPSGKVSVFLRPEERHLSEICRASATFAAMVRSRGSCGFVTAVVTLVVALACFPQTVSGLYADDSQVVSLDPKSFKAKVTNDVQSFYLVEFYAPWCGHCKKLAPEYEAAARAIKKEKAPATLAAVDCDKHKALCDTHGVSGFPTILSFSAGREKASKGEKYEGARDKDGIVEFVTLKSAAKTSVDDLLAPRLPYADVHSFLHHGDSSIPKAVLLTEGVASGSKTSSNLSWLASVAVKFKVGRKKSAAFGYARAEDDKGAVARTFGVVKFPSVVCVKLRLEKGTASESGRFTVLTLGGDEKVGETIRSTKSFIDLCQKMDPSDAADANSKPLPSFPPPRRPRKIAETRFGELTETNLHDDCLGGFAGTCVVLAFRTGKQGEDAKTQASKEALEASKEALSQTSKKYRNDPFSFLWVDTGADAGAQSFLKGFGLDASKNAGDDFPALLAIKTGKRNRFAVKNLDKALSENTASQFVDQILAGDVVFAPLKKVPEFEPEYLRFGDEDPEENAVEVILEDTDEPVEETNGEVVEIAEESDEGEETGLDAQVAAGGGEDADTVGEL